VIAYDGLNRMVRTIANYVPVPGITDPYVYVRSAFTHGVNNDQNLIAETAYNERGLVKSQTDVLGNVTLFGYDLADRLVKTIQSASQPNFNSSYLTGDSALGSYLASDAPDQDIITTSQYDAAGNLVKTVDAPGNPPTVDVNLHIHEWPRRDSNPRHSV
jgi:YD repeat-containing protein